MKRGGVREVTPKQEGQKSGRKEEHMFPQHIQKNYSIELGAEGGGNRVIQNGKTGVGEGGGKPKRLVERGQKVRLGRQT